MKQPAWQRWHAVLVRAGCAAVLGATALGVPCRAYDTSDTTAREVNPGAVWIVDPARPGPDVPPVGRSLFDHLFMVRDEDGSARYSIPFPFTALLGRLESLLSPSDNGGGGVRRVHIPLGRSLHRHAAAPDYFEFPRVVIGINGDPVERHGEAGLMLRERLFLGYQEKSQIIEVISYNPDAGRFEFQVVRDYGPDGSSRVTYSNRALCMSCHQNAGPIFPGAPWHETDANPEILARIQAARPGYIDRTLFAPRFDDPWGIDYATDQANYFASYQFLWREGCGADEGPDREAAIRCRGALLSAALKFRLTGGGDFQGHESRYRRDFVSVLSANWARRWPNGLLIRTADIPDRDPLVEVAIATFDPLSHRGPRAIWSHPARQILDGTVMQLADFMSEADVHRIDMHLRARGLVERARQRSYESACRFSDERPATDSRSLHFDCEGSELEVRGRLYIGPDGAAKGVLDQLITADFPEHRFITLHGAPDEASADSAGTSYRDLRLLARESMRLGARTRDGHRLERLRLEWIDERNGRATLDVLQDYAPLSAAIDGMIRETSSRAADALSDKPFRRRAVLQSLHRQLEIPALAWCCEDDAWMAPVEVESASSPSLANAGAGAGSLESFYAQCATCHAGDRVEPPGFLHGGTQQVRRNLRQCAPRIAYRLSMWHTAPDDRGASPMPPAAWLSHLSANEDEWRAGDALAALRSAVAEWLDGPTRDRLADGLDRDEYLALPTCLAASE